eukprot:7250796-Lingulodinium_polyedra.AAC.1
MVRPARHPVRVACRDFPPCGAGPPAAPCFVASSTLAPPTRLASPLPVPTAQHAALDTGRVRPAASSRPFPPPRPGTP